MPDIIEHIQTIAQPVEISVKVGMDIDSKGQKKPSVEIKTTQHLSLDGAKGMDVIVDGMLNGSLRRCKDTIKKAMEE